MDGSQQAETPETDTQSTWSVQQDKNREANAHHARTVLRPGVDYMSWEDYKTDMLQKTNPYFEVTELPEKPKFLIPEGGLPKFDQVGLTSFS